MEAKNSFLMTSFTLFFFFLFMAMDMKQNPNNNFPMLGHATAALLYGIWLTLAFNKAQLCRNFFHEEIHFDVTYFWGSIILLVLSFAAVAQEGTGIPFQ